MLNNTVAQFLWRLLDDIDTASDVAKADDRAYRERVERIQRRRFEVGSTDGYVVKFKSLAHDVAPEIADTKRLAKAMCFADYKASCETWKVQPSYTEDQAWNEATQERRDIALRHAEAIRSLAATTATPGADASKAKTTSAEVEGGSTALADKIDAALHACEWTDGAFLEDKEWSLIIKSLRASGSSMHDDSVLIDVMLTSWFGPEIWNQTDQRIRTERRKMSEVLNALRAFGAERVSPLGEAELEQRHAEEVELQEIADGAYGDNPGTRGLARDRLLALKNQTKSQAVPETAAGGPVEVRKAELADWRNREQTELLEVADGAYGDGDFVRGQARRRLAEEYGVVLPHPTKTEPRQDGDQEVEA